jgi:hypothetical protein
MSAPEMAAVTTTNGLYRALKHLRPFYQDAISWERFLLQARYMWMVYRGRVRPPALPAGNMPAAGKTSTETTQNAVMAETTVAAETGKITTLADSIIARGRRREP